MHDLRKNGHIYRGKGHVLQFVCLISSDASATVTYHLQSDLSVTFMTQPYSYKRQNIVRSQHLKSAYNGT